MRKALGRGLEALLPAGGANPTPVAVGPLQIPLDAIAPNPDQPRRHFAPDALAELSVSIRRHGILQPVVVRRVPGGFELIAGERRLRAARMAGLQEVPAVVRESDERTRMELALVENLQREDLPPLDEAEAYRTLMDEYELTQDEVASRVGKSRPAVANALRLLGLPEEVKARLRSGELTAGHARAVLSVPGTDAQVALAREIVERNLPKSEAERVALQQRGRSRIARPRGAARGASAGDPNWRALTEDLTRKLGTRVRLIPRARGGVIEIEFYSLPELDRLVQQLAGYYRGDELIDSCFDSFRWAMLQAADFTRNVGVVQSGSLAEPGSAMRWLYSGRIGTSVEGSVMGLFLRAVQGRGRRRCLSAIGVAVRWGT